MKSRNARVTRGIPVGARIKTCDNSGAKVVKVFTVYGVGTTKRRRAAAGVGDKVMGAVIKGRPDMRKKVVQCIIVRQKKEYRRPDGRRIKFEDNALVVLKDDKGNPKGTMFKGPIAKEAAIRWPAVSKIAGVIV